MIAVAVPALAGEFQKSLIFLGEVVPTRGFEPRTY
jgi:hypothetical protein